jgi:uncharacterized membrane protein YkoI
MNRTSAFFLGLCISCPVLAGHGDHDPLGRCLKEVRAIRSGDVVKVEFLSVTDEGRPAYEIEVRTDNGAEWEFECSAKNAAILEIEQEVDSPNHELFKRRMKVSESEARKIATALYPGKIVEVEYEIEANGDASYEFDIKDDEGVEFKVEVDAASGDIVEVQVERWEIGSEDTTD